MSIYSKVPISKPGRNAFNLTHTYKCSANIGELIPIARPIECVPGDTMITGNISEVELSPVITNFKGDLFFETWQFFVSNDSLYLPASDSGKFTDILASMQDPQNILPLPYMQVAASFSGRHYLHNLYGTNDIGYLNTSYINAIAYPHRAYVKIVNEFFRDENLEPEYIMPNGGTNISGNFYEVNYKKDRYTSAFTSTQKGTEIRFNIGVDAPIKKYLSPQLPLWIDNTLSNGIPIIGLNNNTPSNEPPILVGTSVPSTTAYSIEEKIDNTVTSRYYVDLSATRGITINDLRLYNKLQKWQERNQLCGTRIKEYLLANYGVTPDDETLQRPVLIGHTKVPVVVNSFAANIKNTNSSGDTWQNLQGSRGATADANSAFKYGKWFCKEFGWIITLGTLRPKSVYTGGIHKSLIKDSVIDFFNPIFQHLGQQAIKKAELYLTNNKVINNTIFGYTNIYNEMRHLEDFICPDLLSAGYQSKNIFRIFASNPPTLSRSFTVVKATDYDYLFAVPSTTAPQALISSTNLIKAIRPLSKYGTPSLIA